jgi:VCBS repeat-containing protein
MASRPTRTRRKKPRPLESSRHTPCAVDGAPRFRRLLLEPLERRHLLASYTIAEDTPLILPWADSAPAAVLLTPPAHGTVDLNANRRLIYTPTANYNGTDSFSYCLVSSPPPACISTETITITVTPVNDPPVAVNDSYSIAEDGQLTVSIESGVKANDTDVDSGFLTAALLQQPSNGTLAFGGNGNFAYRPAANFFGIDRFTYLVSDGQALSNVGTVTISVTITDDAPTAINDRFTVAANSTATINASGALANDIDIDGNLLTAEMVSGPTRGTLSLYADGGFRYVPETGFTGADSFTYRAHDGQGTGNTAIVNLNVGQANRPPVAANDSYLSHDATPVSVAAPGVIGGDNDPDSDTLAAFLVTGPAQGTLTLRPDGSFTYVPASPFSAASFVYRVTDGQLSSTATVTITNFSCGGCFPSVFNDHYMLIEDTALSVPAPGVLANDPNPAGGTLTATLIDQPRYGFVTLLPNGSFTLVPAANFNGQASFTYRSSDSSGNSRVLTAGFTVLGVNDFPFASNDSYSVTEDNPLTIPAHGLLLNDTDVDGNDLTAVLSSQPANGRLTLNANGSLLYWPNANYNGTDSFTYRATDGVDTSNLATVNISVTPVNDPPVANGENYSMFRNTTLEIGSPGLLANDSDVDSPTLSASLHLGPNAPGTVTLNADGSFRFTPPKDFRGFESFSYRVSDGVIHSTAMVTVNVGVCGAPPYASDDTYTIAEDSPLSVSAPGILVNDSDCGERLTNPSVITPPPPSKGTLTLNTDGSFVFLPAPNFHGTASFTYRAVGYGAVSNTATVTITVTPVNDPPVANIDSYIGGPACGGPAFPLTVGAPGVLGNDFDVDRDSLTARLVTAPTRGSVTLNADGSFTYSQSGSFAIDAFTYQASDSLLASNTTVVIGSTHENCPPRATNDNYTTSEDVSLVVSPAQGVLANDEPLGEPLSAILVSGPNRGALTLNGNGSFTYVPNANYSGTDSFTYRASAGPLSSTPATVTITVVGCTDAPVMADDLYSVPEDQTLTISAPGVLLNDADPDSEPLTATLISGPTHGHLNLYINGSFTYTPNPNYFGTDSFTYRNSNPGPCQSNIGTVRISVAPVNDPPVADNDVYLMWSDYRRTISVTSGVLTNDTDADGDQLAAVLVEGPAAGTLTLNANGSFTYHSPGGEGIDSFLYRATDGAAFTTATVRLSVQQCTRPIGAFPDIYLTTEDSVLFADRSVLETDSFGCDETPLTATLLSQPLNGVVSMNSDGTFTFRPASDFVGNVSFTYRAGNGGEYELTGDVTISVTPTNDAPAFQVGTNQNVTDESAPQSINAWATVISAGPPDEAGQSLSFTATNDRPNLFSATPAIDSSGRLTFTPAPNASGTATVTVILNDSGGTADGGSDTSPPQTFLITITKQRPAHNVLMPLDATGDYRISPLDALVIINFLNRQGPGPVAPGSAFFYDINGDGHITALDALIVMNHFNRLAAAGEGESASAAPSFNPQPEAQAFPLQSEGEGPHDDSNLVDVLALDSAQHATRRRRLLPAQHAY